LDETAEQLRIREIAARHPAARKSSLAILQEIQKEFNYIPASSFPIIKEHVKASEGQLFALATFYKALSLTPKGRHVIKLCDGTACHMRGANNLVGEITRQLGIGADGRSPDGHFSLELVNCLGSCALAPVMVIDDVYYGKVTMGQLPGILDSWRPGGEHDGGASGRGHEGGGGDE
jgi:NADH-quinone oxidoreductase subunit E